MNPLKSVFSHIAGAFKVPKPYNWGYPVFFGSLGIGFSFLLLKLMFSGAFQFSSTSLIGCAVSVLVIVMFAFVVPSVLIGEKSGVCITGHYTGIGALILAFLSGAPIYLLKSSLHNIISTFWLRAGGTVTFPAVFYHVEGISGQLLSLEILIDTIIPAFGFSLFFLGAVWQGFSDNNRRWAFFFIPLFFAAFSFDFLDLAAIIIIGWWLCIVRDRTGNIYGPILSLLGARVTGILIDSVVSEVDLTTVRVYSDIPTTIYFSAVPAIIVAVILMAFFNKTLGEFHNSYSNTIYGDSKKLEEGEGEKAESVLAGFNVTFLLGVLILMALWILLMKGVRL